MMTTGFGTGGGDWRHEQGMLARRLGGEKEPSLYYYATRPVAAPHAIVGILHGYPEYGARYAHVMDAWAERGIASVAVDFRGLGRARGRRGFCERFDQYLSDAAELRHVLAERAPPSTPAFLFGHSFGGLVAASYATADPWEWKGLALTSPFFALALKVPPLKVAAGRVASLVWPTLALPSGLSGADVTRDPVRARAYDQDPLVLKKANVRWFTEVERAQAQSRMDAPRLMLPLCILAAGVNDRVADVAATRRYFEGVGSAEKLLDVRDGSFHEVLSDPDWRTAADILADWFLARAR